MAINPYFSFAQNDQKLIDELTIETIKVTGQNIYYIPREYVQINSILGEDIRSKFENAYVLEAYIQTVFSFDGQADVISKFGVIITDRATIQISKTRFRQEIMTRHPEILRPREGDLIYFPLSGSLFEINKMEDEIPFYQLGALTTYTLTLEAFVYSHEEFETGMDVIDQVATDRNDFIRKLSLVGINGGSYRVGEEVKHTGYTAVVHDFIRGLSYSTLYVYDEQGTYIPGITLVGSYTNAGYTGFGSTYTNTKVPTDPVRERSDGDNVDFDFLRAKENLFDFTDTDPFSEGHY
jgi:hypothetical protein